MRGPLLLALLLCAGTASAAPEELTSGRYHASITIDPPDGQDIFILTRDGVQVFTIIDALRMRLGRPLQVSDAVHLPDDVTGDGVIDLVVFGWSGGAHGCFTAWVLSLGDEFRVAAKIPGWNEEPQFRQLDDDTALETVVQDASFDYWPMAHGDAPFVNVALDWRGDGYQPSAGLTALLQVDDEEAGEIATRLRNSGGWQYPYQAWGEVFRHILRMLYAGRMTEASDFIEAAWGGERKDMARLFVEFSDRLARSPYYATIAREMELDRHRPSVGDGNR